MNKKESIFFIQNGFANGWTNSKLASIHRMPILVKMFLSFRLILLLLLLFQVQHQNFLHIKEIFIIVANCILQVWKAYVCMRTMDDWNWGRWSLEIKLYRCQQQWSSTLQSDVIFSRAQWNDFFFKKKKLSFFVCLLKMRSFTNSQIP